MFDRGHFIAKLNESCPQMTILPELKMNLQGEPLSLTPNKLLPGRFAGYVLTHPQDWRRAFDHWLSQQKPPPHVVNIGMCHIVIYLSTNSADIFHGHTPAQLPNLVRRQ